MADTSEHRPLQVLIVGAGTYSRPRGHPSLDPAPTDTDRQHQALAA